MNPSNIFFKYILIVLFAMLSLVARSQSNTRKTNAENRVAILPINYIGDGNEVKMDEMRYRLQGLAHQFLRKEAVELKFQDPAETNAMLLKHGVTEQNIRQFLPAELADYLQVEYVLTGTVTEEFGSVITHHNNEVRRNTRANNYPYDRRVRVRETRTGSSTSTQSINTMIELNIYNDRGEKIFGRERKSLLSDAGTYKVGLHYLLKRSPLYKK